MSNLDKVKSEIEGLFKSNVILGDNLEDILNFKPSTLVGIDNVSSNVLAVNGIQNIKDLSNLSINNPPEISQIPPSMLIKWTKIAMLIKKVVSGQIFEEKKVLMVGLDNGGKTSLLTAMRRNFSVLKDILPTKGVHREALDFFGYSVISWDLGGQAQFRENWYFEKPELYFSESNIMIYVIDIQDRNRFGESSGYLTRILEFLDGAGEKVPVMLVLNKSDPDIVSSHIWEENINYIRELFNPILDNYGFQYDYAITSIYQVDTIIQMFSDAIKKFSETSEIIKHIILDFGISINAIALNILSLEGLIFGSYGASEADEELLNKSGAVLLRLEQFYKTKNFMPDTTIIFELPTNNLSIRGELLFEYSEKNIPVYLFLLAKKTDILAEKLEVIRTELQPLVKLFL